MAMKARKDIINLAAALNAEVEVWANSEDSYTVEATAPDGYQWVESGGVSLVTRWFTNWPETKAEAMNDILARMQQGIETETI